MPIETTADHGTGPAERDAQAVKETLGRNLPSQVRMADLDFKDAPVVQPIGFRFIIPVPDLGTQNRVIQVKNWKGEDETVVGYAFRNGVDNALQAVKGDGTGVILLLVNPEKCDRESVSKQILGKIAELGGSEALDVSKLDVLLEFIRTKVGITDMYNSDDSIAKSMQAQAGISGVTGRPVGLYEKKDKAGPKAVFVEGHCAVLDGPHAGEAVYPNGFMAVEIPGKEGKPPTYRSIAPGAITACYRLATGEAITDPGRQLSVSKG